MVIEQYFNEVIHFQAQDDSSFLCMKVIFFLSNVYGLAKILPPAGVCILINVGELKELLTLSCGSIFISFSSGTILHSHLLKIRDNHHMEEFLIQNCPGLRIVQK